MCHLTICYSQNTHFQFLFVQWSQCKIFSTKIIWVSFKPLCYCNLMQKKTKNKKQKQKQKKTYIDFSQNKTWKLHSRPIYLPKNFKAKFLSQKTIKLVSSLYASVTSYKKSEISMNLFLKIPENTHFGSILCTFWP